LEIDNEDRINSKMIIKKDIIKEYYLKRRIGIKMDDLKESFSELDLKKRRNFFPQF